jgi:two-component system cell cycle response regulator DivK
VGQKILVVEDNELNLKLFCDLLRAHGYEAEPVRDGREAVERARAFGPELVVMDIQMPYISGLELIEQLKADAELKRVPIMAVTAYAAKGDEERIRDAGAEGYVSKPISLMKFIEAVRALLDAAPSAEPQDVEVTRRFEAPPERLFDAWLDPESAGRWLFATPEGEMVRTEIDAQVGGRYKIVERRDGEDVLHTGTYEEIDPPHRLVFTLAVPKYSSDEARVSVDIAPEDSGGASLTLRQSVPAQTPVPVEKIREGWETLLDGLGAELEEGRHSGETENPAPDDGEEEKKDPGSNLG